MKKIMMDTIYVREEEEEEENLKCTIFCYSSNMDEEFTKQQTNKVILKK